MSEWVRTHKYCLLLLYFPVYLAAFFLIEQLPLDYHIIRCPLDALIPFNRYMVIPYALWFFWFPGWLIYFLLNSREDFIKLSVIMFTGMTIALITYVIWPNGIDLREPVEENDIFAKAVMLIRQADTPYGVCPSIHVSTITAICLIIMSSELEQLNPTVRAYCIIITILIAISTMSIKQHSIVDVFSGAVLSILLYFAYPFIVTKTETGKKISSL